MHTAIYTQTISEKKAGLSFSGSDLNKDMQKVLSEVNADETMLRKELQDLYSQVNELYRQNAPQCSYQELLERINETKRRLDQLETDWRELATENQNEEYALWHQPQTTLEQLIIDYGSQNYVYLMPPEIAAIKISVNSNLPIPRSFWSQMLETILTQNGVGIKQLNPYLRQLYLIRDDKSSLKLFTNKRQDLDIFPSDTRIGFVVSPEPSDARRVWTFLEKFVNPNSTVLQMVGRDILILAPISEIQELLKLYDFMATNRGDKEYKIITLGRVNAEEMAKILGAIFDQLSDEPRPIERPMGLPPSPSSMGANPKSRPGIFRPETPEASPVSGNGLKIIALSHLAQSVFLIGTKEEIRKAEKIIADVENQVGEAREKVIYWYTTKHSDADELAEVISRVYDLIIETRPGPEGEQVLEKIEGDLQQLRTREPKEPFPPLLSNPYEEKFFLSDQYVVNPVLLREPKPANQGRNNFLVDPKTGAMVMVVEADILPKLKELLRKLDVPKKMVQIEVLLFEKKILKQNNFGLNLLKIGCLASDTNCTSGTFNFDPFNLRHLNNGIFYFLISREKSSGIPAYDLAYKFLLSQEDVQINASPSVLAINQTLATVEITEEISVNTGVYEIKTVDGVTSKDAFARAQYGITIGITPTIHMNEEKDFFDDETDYVTLSTDIIFQTFKPSPTDRPDVTTRHIENEVSIPDGQTVILGGLRQKNIRDKRESIPFIGELPCVGKLFSSTEMRDDSTEMFIFLTPKIINDPAEDLCRIRRHELCRRPGDIPEFLCHLVEARDWDRRRVMQGTMAILFGRPAECCVSIGSGEYDGR